MYGMIHEVGFQWNAVCPCPGHESKGMGEGNEFVAQCMDQQNGDMAWLLCCPGTFGSSYPAFEGFFRTRYKAMAVAHAVDDNACRYSHPGNGGDESKQVAGILRGGIFYRSAEESPWTSG